MKNKIIITVVLIFALLSCKVSQKEIRNDLSHPYYMCQYEGGFFISNFGGDSVNYFNTKPNGFISYYKNGKSNVVLPSNDQLYSPKGIAIKDNYIFVADVNSILVFNMEDYRLVDKINFPQGDAFVNDLLVLGGTLFVTVTNYNAIYLLNVEAPQKIDHNSLLEYLSVPYPSSMKQMGEYLFISSNSFSGAEYEDKIIHVVDDFINPSIRRVIHEPGDYQGLEFSPSKTRLIFCNQEKSGYIGNLIFENGEYIYEKIAEDDAILNSILLLDNKLYISDLKNSVIYIKDIMELDMFPTIIKSE